jgi:hypothetical protein
VHATPADEGAHRSHGFRRFWIGGAVSFDFFAMPAANDVCLLDLSGKAPATAGNPYNCVDPASKSSFPDTATTNASIAKHGDLVQSGAAIGNTRLLVSFDYALSPNLLLGARAGYVFATDPGSYPGAPFGPVHVEVRATYLFGDDAIRRGFAPMVLVATGVGEFDAYVQVPVFLNQPQGGTPIQRPENAWLTAGPAFVAAGPGLRILLTEEVAATAALKFEMAFGGSAGTLFGAAPEVALQLGF